MVLKNLGKIMTCKNFFGPKNVWFKNFLVKNKYAPKVFWVQRNLKFKEIWAQKIWLKTDLSFKIIAQRFLMKTNFVKILGPERFGSKSCYIYVRIK